MPSPDPAPDFSRLSRADLVHGLACSRSSRKSVKMFLASKRLPGRSADVDALLDFIAARPDYNAIQQEAARVQLAPRGDFMLGDQLCRTMQARGFTRESAIKFLSDRADVDPQDVEDLMDERDIPLDIASAILSAAGAVKIVFSLLKAQGKDEG